MHQKSRMGLLAPDVAPIEHHAGHADRRHHLEQRKHQIEAQIASIDARDQAVSRKRETRANIIIGAVMRSHAALHSAFATALADILDLAVRRRADRELLASVLGLPSLIGGSDPAVSPQPTSDAIRAQNLHAAPRLRSELRQYAAEITIRKHLTDRSPG